MKHQEDKEEPKSGQARTVDLEKAQGAGIEPVPFHTSTAPSTDPGIENVYTTWDTFRNQD